jgi:multidrug efflux pump subunit AcrA (membrane-fusion protein)
MILFDSKSKKQLISLFEDKKVAIEGNILKLIDTTNDPEFEEYIKVSIEKDKESRKKRLDMTKQVQLQNKELLESQKELEYSQQSLKESLEQIQSSMQEVESAKEQAENLRQEAEIARQDAEVAKEEAEAAREEAELAKTKVENDLDILQRKTQNELIGTIVKVALYVIVGVGFVTTGVYLLALFTDKDTAVISSTWANIIGILLTNAFSIVGTIMGVKYASEK